MQMRLGAVRPGRGKEKRNEKRKLTKMKLSTSKEEKEREQITNSTQIRKTIKEVNLLQVRNNTINFGVPSSRQKKYLDVIFPKILTFRSIIY